MTLSAIHPNRHTSKPPADSATDPLLEALAQARQRFNQATIELRILIALAREFTAPRPYTLTQIAQAADMSTHSVRTGYGPREMAYLQLILTGGQNIPPFLHGPLAALRHQPSPQLDGDIPCYGDYDINTLAALEHAGNASYDRERDIWTVRNSDGTTVELRSEFAPHS